ncbi:hypothetical protein ABT120_48755 [Nonomuraea angiospora]|uniref:NACHT and WD40 repeat domain-containing protein n=1 Tax=Nonomuraea angiospora TaxID=46172 RepID=UPI00332318E3
MPRRTWIVFLAVSFILIGTVAWWMAGANLDENDARASVAAFVIGLFTILLMVAGMIRRWQSRRAEEPKAPDALAQAGNLAKTILAAAVKGDDALSRPHVLPLSWRSAAAGLGDGTQLPPPGSRVKERKLSKLSIGFQQAIGDLAAHYRRISNGRMVILGEPGAGKSVLAFMLMRGLLDERADGDRVPVLLSAASWDPTRQGLNDWIVRTLAVTYYGGATEIPRRLREHGLLLPVVDGLDEMPEVSRRLAVREINDTLGWERPIVLTCRLVEYGELIDSGGPPLRRAPVIVLQPLEIEDVTAYLRAVAWPSPARLQALYEHLDEHPGGPVAAALSTPLTVSLLRTVGERLGDLTHLFRLESRAAVEDTLVEDAVTTAYDSPTRRGWAAGKARRWLTYLAAHLHEHGERELAWWRLGRRVLSPPAVVILALCGGVLLMLLSWGWMLALGAQERLGLTAVLRLGAFIGGGFIGLAVISWYAGGAAAAPGRLAPTVTGSAGRLRDGLVTGLAIACLPVLPLLTGIGLVITLVYGWPPENTVFYLSVLAAGLATMAVTGLAVAVYRWLNAPPKHSSEASPAGLLAEDRRASLVSALAAGTVVGLGAAPALITAIMAVQTVQTWYTGWSGEPSLAELAIAAYPADWSDPLFFGAVVLLPGVAFAMLTLFTRAWPGFAWTRVVLAARGRLPWRLMTFLEHTHRQGLLTRFGGVYQFRHVRMQDWLVSARTQAPAPSVRTKSWRRALPALSSAALLVVCAALLRTLPDDTSSKTLLTGATSTIYFDGDGRVLVALDQDLETVRVWNTETGRPIGRALHTRRGIGKGEVRANRNTALIAAIEAPRTLTVLDMRTGRQLCQTALRQHNGGDGHTVMFSPDGRTLLTATNEYVYQLWDARACAAIGAPMEGINSPSFSPDGSVLKATGYRGSPLMVWNAHTGARIDDGTILRTYGPIPEFTADSRFLVNMLSATSTQLIDLRTGKTPGDPIGGLAGDPYRSPLITIGGRSSLVRWVRPGDGLQVWQLWGAQRTLTFPGVVAYDAGEDGNTLVGLSRNGEITLWSLEDGRAIASLPTGRSAPSAGLQLSPDERTVAVRRNADPEVEFWDVRQRSRVGAVSLDSDRMGWWFVPGTRVAAVAESTDEGKTKVLRTLNLDTGVLDQSSLPAYEVTAPSHKDDRIALITADQRAVDIWDVATGRRITTLTGHTSTIYSVHFSPDDRLLATRASDGTVRLWPMPGR